MSSMSSHAHEARATKRFTVMLTVCAVLASLFMPVGGQAAYAANGQLVLEQLPMDDTCEGLAKTGTPPFDAATVGRRLPVLFERRGRKPGQIAGRSPYLQAVHGDGPDSLIGRIVEVDIVSVGPNSLTGVIKSEFEWREPVQAAV